MLQHPSFMQDLETMKFDIVLADGFPLAPCMTLIGHRLQLPFILSSSIYAPWVYRIPSLPSFWPVPTNDKYTDKMSFIERFQNTKTYIMFCLFGFGEYGNTHLLDMYAPSVASWDDLRRKMSLFIVNRDHHLDWIIPGMPHVAMVPGLTTGPADPLPTNLQTITDQATNGIIIFSMGSSLEGFPEDILLKFMQAFKQLKQVVIMRNKGATGQVEIPSNVHLMSWLPQNDLLGHKNTVLFITHCGNNGQHEAAYHGVPMLGLPVFGEQADNANRVVKRNMGLRMNLNSLTVEELLENISEVLHNPVYRDNTRRLSKILKDRFMNPREEAAYWIEHVAKFGGDHMRSHALDMPWYSFYMFDIFGCMLGAAVLCVIVVSLCGLTVFNQCKRKTHEKLE